ncbi:hypothetical protein SAMN06265348_107186 [Pedobacter westerhofensis]|uniref:Uncharacterized protein n=1 Tax=Pedobacter westerhofensis TaxID=425512 RepID=A0A521E7R2_9SPHI|nr:hypothetical protein [Pedobacter westerhofensis]SMO79975.1 hypothetical protein SAMN06265348_107186 [Pedobacter westerhofensis]
MKIVLKRLLIIELVFSFVNSYGFSANTDTTKMKALHITTIFQVPHSSGDILIFHKTPDIIYDNDYVVLRSPYTKTSVTGRMNEAPTKIKVDTTYAYYICRRGEKYGLLYDSATSSIGKRYFVDSLINDFLRIPAFFYGVKSKNVDFINVISDKKKGILIEKFVDRRTGVQEPDSSYFYYRKKPLAFSYLIKEKRPDQFFLYKAIMVFNPVKKGAFPGLEYDVKKYTHTFEISEIGVPDEQKIRVLIDKFKRQGIRKL